MRNYTGIFVTFLWCFTLGLFAQDLTITSVVTNEFVISFTNDELRGDTGDLKVTKDDITKLCQKYFDMYYDKLDLIEKSRISTAKDRLKVNANYAADLSANAVMATAVVTLEYMPL